MTEPLPAPVAAEAGLSLLPSPSSAPSSASRAETEALLIALADHLTRNLSRLTSCSRRRELERQGKLLDAAFSALVVQGTDTHSNPLPVYRAALQSQLLYLQLDQLLDDHDKKIRRNELIRNKRPRRKKQPEVPHA